MRTGELYQRYYGLYVGTVVSVDDPQNIGRIRIHCDQYADSEGDPLWAVVARPAGGETSVFFTPNLGDQVIFGFQEGDVNGPVVIGYAHNSGDRKPPEQVIASPKKKHGIVTKIGSVVFDEDANKIVVTFDGSSSPSSITINDDGITLDTQAKVVVNAGNVFVGSGSASEPIPLGQKLHDWLAGHKHPSAMGPTAPPGPDDQALLQSILSTKNTVD
jgi:uncharacterized protein involved in type VI secretion and phage assembly